MKVTFLGGANEVGASSTLLEISGKKLLVDSGIRISSRSTRGIESDQLPDLQQVTVAGGPDYILVTHAHTDHTGSLPLLLEHYPRVPVIATLPTIALTKVLQADAQQIMKSRQEEEGELPLFDEIAVNRLLESFQIVEFRQTVRLGDGVQVTYHPAGHIIGAASLVIESEEGIVVMSGDLSMTPQRAVVKAQIPRVKADFLVLESTYGGRLHANRAAEEKRLVETLQRVIERGGKALIPAFALGRAQEIIQILLHYRDELNAPVWVDGMVRAVCQAYKMFPELLPPNTVKAAGEDDLFFRKNIKAIKSPIQREEIARSEGACIIVASSGMLTGGPSAAFAKWLAGDARNGIFLTGYQDEESPGRFIQNLIKAKEREAEVAFTIDDSTVSLRCELGTYALSAHADESELISIADAFGANDIALVHGDHGARHSLASGLRERGKIVRMPASGISYELTYTKRPWGVGVTRGAQETEKPLDPPVLWETMKEQAGSFFSARELAYAWWGDVERANEVTTVLATDGVYFAQDWRKSSSFQVRSAEKVRRSLTRRAIMRAHPNLVNQLVIFYDVNFRVRIGIVTEAGVETFKAKVLKARGQSYPADLLVWAIGDWKQFQPPDDSEISMMKQLNLLWQKAESLRDILMPFEKRQLLFKQAEPIDPAALIPAKLPEGVDAPLALLTIIVSLAKDGVVRTGDTLTLKRVEKSEPLEMNLARQTALAAFPPEARLRKVGMDTARNRLNLSFDFPVRAIEKYGDITEILREQTGWEVVIQSDINQQALGTALYEFLGSQGQLVKGPSFYLDKQEVHVEVAGVEDTEKLKQDYEALTGFQLVIKSQATPEQGVLSLTKTMANGQPEPMEINKAYGVIREALEVHGLYKTSLKQGQIVLSFISPQVGIRHEAKIAELAEKTGYSLSIHPHPNQNEITQVAQRLAREAGLAVRKGPSLRVDRTQVVFTLHTMPPKDIEYEVCRLFEDETGYQLILET